MTYTGLIYGDTARGDAVWTAMTEPERAQVWRLTDALVEEVTVPRELAGGQG